MLHRAECEDPKTILLKRIVHSAYSIYIRKANSMNELLAAVEPFLGLGGAQEALPQVPEIGVEEVNHLPTMVSVDNRVVIPANTHLRDIVTSADVAHSWAVPSSASSNPNQGVGFTFGEGASSPKLPSLPSSPINTPSSGGSSRFSEFYGEPSSSAADEHNLSQTGQSSFSVEVSQDSIWSAVEAADIKSKLERENCEFLKNKFLQLAPIREELDQVERSFPGITYKLAPSKAIDLIMKNIVGEEAKLGIEEGAAHSDIRRYKLWLGRIERGTDPDYPPIVPQPRVNDIDMKGKLMEFYRKYSSNGGE